MTDHGITYVKQRLTNCPDLATLRDVWGNIGVEYQRHPEVVAHKDLLKRGFQNEA